MCDLATAALVVSAGGAMLSQQQQAAAAGANRKAVDTANSQRIAAQAAERGRQEELATRRRAVAAGTEAAATPQAMTSAEDAAAGARYDAATAAMPTLPTLDERFSSTPSSTTAVVADNGMQLSKALSEARKRLRGQSFLGGAGEAMTGFGRQLGADNSQIASVDSMARGSLGAYGVESSVRPTQAAADTTLGDALAAAGALGAGYIGRRQGVADAKAGRRPTGSLWG